MYWLVKVYQRTFWATAPLLNLFCYSKLTLRSNACIIASLRAESEFSERENVKYSINVQLHTSNFIKKENKIEFLKISKL